MRWEYNYTDRRFGKTFADLFQVIKHSWIKHRVLVIDLNADYDIIQQKEYYIRTEYWTDEKLVKLHERGYRRSDNTPDHDNLAWIGVPVMIKLSGFKSIEIDPADPAASRDDPMFLNDRMESNLLKQFAKSLARAAALAGMDLQKLILMGAIGIAAVVGMKMFGVF